MLSRFGIYLSRSTCLEIECIIILEANADDRALNIIAQTSEGQEMLRHDALKWKGTSSNFSVCKLLANEVIVPFDLSMSSSQNELYSITFVPTPTQGDKGDTETLFFFSFEGLLFLQKKRHVFLTYHRCPSVQPFAVASTAIPIKISFIELRCSNVARRRLISVSLSSSRRGKAVFRTRGQ